MVRVAVLAEVSVLAQRREGQRQCGVHGPA